jgi:hypothetical protein
MVMFLGTIVIIFLKKNGIVLVLMSESSKHLGTYWLYFFSGDSTHHKIS